ncbi:hypothetical protein [Rhizobium sp. CC-YZS058]|uniref:hypothetical protein n=1 Tax=Rhizobium sp. CC-YZS058 TaxID=3042153 RepID=UPI002B060DAE|nr:hypothetical protein [Rhizobium sp. CC-YZS058]MEA3536712.1 hypothetical protein [Rhizobium sp. CC-YZS058]
MDETTPKPAETTQRSETRSPPQTGDDRAPAQPGGPKATPTADPNVDPANDWPAA